MRLVELEPCFVRVIEPGKVHREVDDIAEAQGIRFLCPACFARNDGPVGTHSILCWFRGRGVGDAEVPGPARWDAAGTGYGDLTLAPSIRLTSGCAWHGYVVGGAVATCGA